MLLDTGDDGHRRRCIPVQHSGDRAGSRDAGAGELMVVSDMFDPVRRLRSFEMIAEVTGSGKA